MLFFRLQEHSRCKDHMACRANIFCVALYGSTEARDSSLFCLLLAAMTTSLLTPQAMNSPRSFSRPSQHLLTGGLAWMLHVHLELNGQHRILTLLTLAVCLPACSQLRIGWPHQDPERRPSLPLSLLSTSAHQVLSVLSPQPLSRLFISPTPTASPWPRRGGENGWGPRGDMGSGPGAATSDYRPAGPRPRALVCSQKWQRRGPASLPRVTGTAVPDLPFSAACGQGQVLHHIVYFIYNL